LLVTVGLSRRNDPYPLVTLGIDDGDERALHHAGGEETVLAKILAEVLLDQGEEIVKNPGCLLKADLVLS